MLIAVRCFMETVRLASERRRTARALLCLSDYLLTDVGLRRNELERVAAGLSEGTDLGSMGQAPAPILVPQQALLRVKGPTMQGCG